MDESIYTDKNVREVPGIGATMVDAIRLRPSMYVGSLDFFGFIHYLVCPFALIFARNPGRIDVTVTDTGFEIDTDAKLITKAADDSLVIPFEHDRSGPLGGGNSFEACVLNALSQYLIVRVVDSGSVRTLTYERGHRTSETTSTEVDGASGTRLSFAPDRSILTVTDLSPAVFESYLRRMSFLHAGVRIRLSYPGATREYDSAGGIRDLFESISAPYQLLHTPIHIKATEGELQLELVLAYQSWSDNLIWSFVNKGRAVEGGTHETGLRKALNKFANQLKLRRSLARGRNGVVALMSITYPKVVWQGCIKARIGNPELLEMIPRLVLTGIKNWLAEHPDVAHQLTQLETFTFPDVWFD